MNPLVETVNLLGVRQRRKLEGDLYDGAQQRLVSLALTLRMAREGRLLRRRRGGPSAGPPAGRSALRLCERIEPAGYFVVSEALTNVARYASASRATVAVISAPTGSWSRSATMGWAARTSTAAPACAGLPIGWPRSAAGSRSIPKRATERTCAPASVPVATSRGPSRSRPPPYRSCRLRRRVPRCCETACRRSSCFRRSRGPHCRSRRAA
jgi:hypothetical protein